MSGESQSIGTGRKVDGYKDVKIVEGSAAIGKVSIDQTTPGTTNAVNTIKYNWADAAARAAQTGMAAGDVGWQIDTNILYRYGGAAWVLFITLG